MTIENDGDNNAAEWERALAETGDGRYVLRLYLTGSTRRSVGAVETIKALCERYLAGRYELEVVDLYQQPDRAQAAQIIAAPTLVKELPLPLRRFIGNLANADRVLVALNLKSEEG